MEAFEAIIRRHQDGIFAFALNLTGRRAEAEDVAQEAFIRAWRAYGGYDAERRRELKERAWPHRIAGSGRRRRWCRRCWRQSGPTTVTSSCRRRSATCSLPTATQG